MKRLLTIPFLTLICITGLAQAESAKPALGQISFVGRIVNGLCSTPTSIWREHVGRNNGINPAGMPPVAGSDDCAGVAATSSISLATIASRKGEAGIITVTYN